ncbi:MAG: hypothetical protein ACRC7O_11350 [Fimbriiglobus sp.]
MPPVRRFAIVYLTAQGIAALAWWAVLAAWPPARAYFKPAGAPDSTLFAFAVADIVLFAVGSLAAAVGLRRNAPWAWPVLVAHAGAAAYAGLYCVTLPVVAGGSGWLAAVGMAPAVVVPPVLAWRLRPRREHAP